MRFKARLFRYSPTGSWIFVEVPARFSPPATHAWGRTPVRARVDGIEWDTSVWRDSKRNATLLAIPKKVRGDKQPGDQVSVELSLRGDLTPLENPARTLRPRRSTGRSSEPHPLRSR